ncbi:winged helix-turn-helix domain-containing protein [Enterococcus hulanensis]|uniref:Winged helix-turn-helix domain-containing protein n=1 Tax=Enterococcus hulanensis TaxID=2559929 RepID=A0ABU3EV04_9ENTE|nr:winged helix-turn-helix domain-containing protein [Enterococcus hulanensis]MDT2598699.1 winged helix-turn-helix domain-containing protein [Enterococcus hulanensis]MDT2607797.1 winged helix-turn-helix domain-containing protein [Enterococcus hulanensis]MDT2615092.1 winged helix-turn-helix domain-containing protein [Enterococcus hulanensis]MDT2626938.1 winged helix-turn-helix domain-containing protein [Enterococcus hulanensis]MDT2654163.1 winged helix-turn-helix domain-containing protein [Ente
MSQILLLTNNPLNEQAFEERLRQLGHEVFTSKLMINLCLSEKSNHDVIRMFDLIILSETLANAEVKELLGKLSTSSMPILRKSDEQLDEAQLEEWNEKGLTEWIESQPTLEVLREKLSGERVRKEGNIVFLPKNEEKRSLTSFSLSSGEIKLFQVLYEQQKQAVPREDLCLRIWNRGKNNSSMSQLSVMVKHLKDKLAGQGVEGPIIETCWGRGYRLHEAVYEQVYLDGVEGKLVKQQ